MLSKEMNRFIRKILILIIFPVLLPFILLEAYITVQSKSIFKETALEKNYLHDADRYKWIEKLNNDSINILAGSSSVRYGLSCRVLNSLSANNSIYVNIAMDARDPIQTYFILKNLDLDSINEIYFGLDPWIYTKRYYKHRNNYLYLDFTFFECMRYWEEHDRSLFTKRYKSLFNYMFNISPQKNVENTEIPDDYGSVSYHGININFNTIEDFFQLEKYGWSNLQFKYLRKIASLCEKKQIKHYLFVPPKRSDWSKVYKKKYTKTLEAYKKKLFDYDVENPIFGTFNILDNKGDSILFAEAYHLNEEGQIKFSKLFYELSIKQHEKNSTNYS